MLFVPPLILSAYCIDKVIVFNKPIWLIPAVLIWPGWYMFLTFVVLFLASLGAP